MFSQATNQKLDEMYGGDYREAWWGVDDPMEDWGEDPWGDIMEDQINEEKGRTYESEEENDGDPDDSSDGSGPRYTVKKGIDWEELLIQAEDFFMVAALADAQLPIGDFIGAFAYGGAALGRAIFGASKMSRTFFEGAKYSSKVLSQMSDVDDIYHAFPKSVDGFAVKFGKSFTQIGADGEMYQWLKIEGTWEGKAGVFEYIKDANGIINHRRFVPN